MNLSASSPNYFAEHYEMTTQPVPHMRISPLSTYNLEEDLIAIKYTWTRLRPRAPTALIDTFAGAHQILSGPDFVSAYDKRLFIAVEPVLTRKLCVFFTSLPGYHHCLCI
jgi:hypothetical protein